jgi:hypothetical protein
VEHTGPVTQSKRPTVLDTRTNKQHSRVIQSSSTAAKQNTQGVQEQRAGEPRFARDFSAIPVHMSDASPLQRYETDKTDQPVAPFPELPPIIRSALQAPSEPLPPGVRESMESRFQRDFSPVRVHTGAEAAESAQSINAQAYTVGSNIVFAPGQYAPTTARGQRLLLHELTHVVQQQQTNGQTTPGMSAVGDSYERQSTIVTGLLGSDWQSARIAVQHILARGNRKLPPRIQRQTAEESVSAELDEFNASLIQTFYSDAHQLDTGILLSYAVTLNDYFTSAADKSLTRIAAAQSLVKFYQELYQRAQTAPREPQTNALLYVQPWGDNTYWSPNKPRQLEDIPLFSSEHVIEWTQTATYSDLLSSGKSSQRRSKHAEVRPPPFIHGEAGQKATSPVREQSAQTVVAAGVRSQELSSTEKLSNTLGSDSELQKGVNDLKTVTISQAVQAVSDLLNEQSEANPQLQGTSTKKWSNAKQSLFSATGPIMYVANRLYVLDRSLHIIPGDFLFDISSLTLAPGTYYFGPFLTGTRKAGKKDVTGAMSANVLLKVDAGTPKVAAGDIYVRSVLHDLFPLLEVGRSALESQAGIAFIVSPTLTLEKTKEHPKLNTKNLWLAIKGATKYMEWAIESELIFKKEHLAQEAVQAVAGMAVGALADLVPEVGAAMELYQAMRTIEWIGNTANVAIYARSNDEIEIASQSIARKMAEWIIGQVISGAIKLGAKAVGKGIAGARGKSSEATTEPPPRSSTPIHGEEGSPQTSTTRSPSTNTAQPTGETTVPQSTPPTPMDKPPTAPAPPETAPSPREPVTPSAPRRAAEGGGAPPSTPPKITDEGTPAAPKTGGEEDVPTKVTAERKQDTQTTPVPKESPPEVQPIVPGGGLKGHEGVLLATGKYAHTESEHIGKDDIYLADRLTKNPKMKVASTFRTREEAEKFIAAALDQNEQAINNWLKTAAPGKRMLGGLKVNFGNEDTGNCLVKGASFSSAGHGVFVQIEKTSSRGGLEYTIVTAYPTPN